MSTPGYLAQAVVQGETVRQRRLRYDPWLLSVCAILLAFGLIMVASTSISIAERRELDPLHYFWRQSFAAGLGGVIFAALLATPLVRLEQLSTAFLFLGLSLLVVVLVPGIGREVNGSMRWISFGSISLQASEPTKLAVVIYVAAYLVRHNEDVRSRFVGFIKPIGVLTVVSALLLLEPDYGVAVVLFATTLGMLFMAGVPLLRFFFWGGAALATLATLAILAPYRLQRLMTFMDPWADPYNSGFQLTQALIAFGRGEWFGVGLGASVQKLFYLPEVHTDFVFAVIGEELGVVGTTAIIGLFMFFVWRIFHLGGLAERAELRFGAYLAYGIGLLMGAQAFVNMGVNMGLLPTKGLPLPLLSYGSNNLILTFAAIAIVCRTGYEARLQPVRPAAAGVRR